MAAPPNIGETLPPRIHHKRYHAGSSRPPLSPSHSRKRSRTLTQILTAAVTSPKPTSPTSTKRAKHHHDHHPASDNEAQSATTRADQLSPPHTQPSLYQVEFAEITAEDIDAVLRQRQADRAFARFLEMGQRKRGLDDVSEEEKDAMSRGGKRGRREVEGEGADEVSRKNKRGEGGAEDEDEGAERPWKRARAGVDVSMGEAVFDARVRHLGSTTTRPPDGQSGVTAGVSRQKRGADDFDNVARASKRARTDMARKRAQSFCL